MLDKLMGKATIGNKSDYDVERFYGEEEETIRLFKFYRDEVIITNLGIYNVDAQGLTGKKVEYKFFPRRALKYVSIETAGSFDRDFDIKIGVDGNTVIANSAVFSAPISIKVNKKETEIGFELYKIIKQMLTDK